jgi:4-hydroxyphenylpyruvate dioxygenase
LRAGYTGTLSLEIFNDVFRATPNRRTALDAMRSLLFLESRVRERLSAADVRVPLFDPPQAVPLDDFAFIEVGVDAASAGTLAAWLVQLGFARYGRHRSKEVSLYRQGDVRIVLNAEPGSDARARADAQGTCVGTLGVSTADPERAAARGAALLSARRDSPRGAQELELPAIVAPGGIVVQFVPAGQQVESDFVADPPGAGAIGDCGLLRIDHVAIGVANDQLDTWTLFARAVLGLAPGESFELADPFGLIRSSGFANLARSLRVVLNAASSERTRSAREALAHGRPGARVQHIALASADIFASMTRLRANGVRFVPISANYYDDLRARLDLDEALVRRMQALDVLYDASAGGAFFHAYGEPFEDQFFFEIVQRHGYDGYGALNAAARLASQEQRA